MQVIVNGSPRELAEGTTVEALLGQLGMRPRQVAVELNRQIVPRLTHQSRVLQPNDSIEIVTLVGGGEPDMVEDSLGDEPLVLGRHRLSSRLIAGTGKYANFELMQQSLAASGSEVITVAVRRERLIDREGRNLLDYIDLKRYTILPNTAGCFTAEDAVRHARLGREILSNLENPGADWVKLEVLGDSKTLLPDPVATLEATQTLVQEGFSVLCYSSDDPIMAKRIKAAGATSVMPAGSPIGSGQGVLNPWNIRIVLEYLKGDDPNYPVIVDAGVGTASDVAIAMELGCDGVLLNTGIAGAKDPVRMAHAMRHACLAGRLAYRAGRIPRKLYATASSPIEGLPI